MDKAQSEICETISQKFAETKFQHLRARASFKTFCFTTGLSKLAITIVLLIITASQIFPDSISREKDNIFSRDCRKDLLRF